MPRQAKLRKKKVGKVTYRFTEAGTPTYFGKTNDVPYPEAKKLFSQHVQSVMEAGKQGKGMTSGAADDSNVEGAAEPGAKPSDMNCADSSAGVREPMLLTDAIDTSHWLSRVKGPEDLIRYLDRRIDSLVQAHCEQPAMVDVEMELSLEAVMDVHYYLAVSGCKSRPPLPKDDWMYDVDDILDVIRELQRYIRWYMRDFLGADMDNSKTDRAPVDAWRARHLPPVTSPLCQQLHPIQRKAIVLS